MKLVQINVSDYGSTGNIMISIQNAASALGHTALSFCGRSIKRYKNCTKITNSLDLYGHALLARFGKNGHGSKIATKKLIKMLDDIDPDVLLLHNIHGYYLNLGLFFDYLLSTRAKIFWTLHDCWTFTGGCAYFSKSNCEKYKTGCKDCSVCRTNYPKSFIDTTESEFKYKSELFSKCRNITFISPSKWLADIAKDSYIGRYPIHVINNGVDTSKFVPCDSSTVHQIKIKYNIPDNKPIILGVSSVWDSRKNPETFFKLAEKMPHYTFVMVGTCSMPSESSSNLINIPRTESIHDMSAIYSSAAVFLNLSVEDNFPLVSLEALSCAAPVISSCLCGSPEAVSPDTGIIVNPSDDTEIADAIKKIISDKNISETRRKCRNRAVTLYDCSVMTDNYLKLLFAD